MPLYQVILFSAAISVVFTQGEIFKFLRRGPWLWRELAKCALCTGVWVGMGMSTLFYGFPHVGGDLWTTARAVATLLGTGAVSGCAALIFVAVWEKLDEKVPGIQVASGATLMLATKPEISVQRAKFQSLSDKLTWPADEAPTDPSTSDSRMTKKLGIDELREKAEASKKDSEE
jgi:hypothetical protein